MTFPVSLSFLAMRIFPLITCSGTIGSWYVLKNSSEPSEITFTINVSSFSLYPSGAFVSRNVTVPIGIVGKFVLL